MLDMPRFSPTFVRRMRLFVSIGLIILLSTVSQSASAQVGPVWVAQYYNNPYLGGTPVLTRQESKVAFNWGLAAPWPEMHADNFSVRWATDAYFAAGTYRFYILADDNLALRVDYPTHPQIDTFNTPSVGQILSTDMTLDARVHHIQIDYQEVTGNAYVYVTWANTATNSTGPDFPIPQSSLSVGGTWTGQYFSNVDLAGAPSLILPETTPSHNWAAGSPGGNIPVDNFSARWTSLQSFNAGRYQFSVQVDDGVRVYVDGALLINEWHNATNTTYSTIINLSAGQHNVQVDYYEAGGMAFLDFNIAPIFVPSSPVVNQPSTTTGTVVTALRLNVRSEPSAKGRILVKINRNESYTVTGKNADSSWWQINVNGTIGWVYWRFFDVVNPQFVRVVTSSTGPSLNQLPTTGFVATTLATVNIRSAPNANGAILGQVARGNQISVTGRNATNTWWQVNYGQITGWVRARFAPLQPNAILSEIPVTG